MDRRKLSTYFGLTALIAALPAASLVQADSEQVYFYRSTGGMITTEIPDPGDTITYQDWEEDPSGKANTKMQADVGKMNREQADAPSSKLAMSEWMDESQVTGADSSTFRGKSIQEQDQELARSGEMAGRIAGEDKKTSMSEWMDESQVTGSDSSTFRGKSPEEREQAGISGSDFYGND